VGGLASLPRLPSFTLSCPVLPCLPLWHVALFNYCTCLMVALVGLLTRGKGREEEDAFRCLSKRNGTKTRYGRVIRVEFESVIAAVSVSVLPLSAVAVLRGDYWTGKMTSSYTQEKKKPPEHKFECFVSGLCVQYSSRCLHLPHHI